MGTQGIVSVTHNGKTIIKAVAGCNGSQAERLGKIIKERAKEITAEMVRSAAREARFGCPRCLVVMDEREALGEEVDDLSPLYRQTFDDPCFNPRWQRGTAAYVEVVEVGEGQGIRTRFISRERYALLKRLVEQCAKKRLDAEDGLPALYTSHRLNWTGRAYLVHDDEWVEPIARKRIRYRPIPEEKRE